MDLKATSNNGYDSLDNLEQHPNHEVHEQADNTTTNGLNNKKSTDKPPPIYTQNTNVKDMSCLLIKKKI